MNREQKTTDAPFDRQKFREEVEAHLKKIGDPKRAGGALGATGIAAFVWLRRRGKSRRVSGT